MAADLRQMLAASEVHDATVGIEDRDLPQMEPRYHELSAIADRLMAEIQARLSDGRSMERIEVALHRHSIMSALIEVRHIAASDAAVRAVEAAYKGMRR